VDIVSELPSALGFAGVERDSSLGETQRKRRRLDGVGYCRNNLWWGGDTHIGAVEPLPVSFAGFPLYRHTVTDTVSFWGRKLHSAPLDHIIRRSVISIVHCGPRALH